MTVQVKFWDLGPARPIPPKAPEPPKGDEKKAEYQLAMLEFEDKLVSYKEELRAFGRAREEFEAWQREKDGPVQLTRHSADAREAMERDPKRYVLKLPKGMQPGRAHLEAVERERTMANEMEEAKLLDPQFGTKGAAA